jgi:hypothetical protein
VPLYLLQIKDEEELRAFAAGLALSPDPKCQKMARKLGSYISQFPAGHCADCGAPADGQMLVSKESSELNEVMFDGFRAVEAKPRIVCRPCWQKGAERLVAEQAQGL